MCWCIPCICRVCADICYLGLLTILGEVHLDKVYGGGAGTVSICMYQDMSLCICVCQRDLGRTLGLCGSQVVVVTAHVHV